MILTQPGPTTTAGGNGAADQGKVPRCTATGGLLLGTTGQSGTTFTARTGNGTAIEGSVSLNAGYAFEASIQVPSGSAVAYSTHFGALGGVGFYLDGTGSGANVVAFGANLNGWLLSCENEDAQQTFAVKASSGEVQWHNPATGGSIISPVDVTRLTPDTPSGDKTITVPAFTGTMLVGPAPAVVSPTSPNRTIEVKIGGTSYYLHAKTTND